MLVGFIGSPCSGKTTTAAKLFAELKDTGMPAEFITEKARSYIAKKKFSLRQQQQEHLFSLTDDDQVEIANSQYIGEMTMNQKNLIVVTDSCVLNSLLYMTPSMRERADLRGFMETAVAKYDVVFICSPVPRPGGEDPNRVHDEAASMHIHQQIDALLTPFLSGTEVHTLTGPSHQRAQAAFSAVLNRFGNSL